MTEKTNSEAAADVAVLKRARNLSSRWQHIALVCLFLTVVVLAISVTAVTLILLSTQRALDRQGLVNDELSVELSCRSQIATEFSLAEAELSTVIAEGLVAVASGTPLDDLVADLVDAKENVRVAGVSRRDSITTCAVDEFDD